MIEKRTRTMFYAPTASRHYASKTGASIGEARALIYKKYPRVQFCQETGEQFDWMFDFKRPEILLRRYARILRRII